MVTCPSVTRNFYGADAEYRYDPLGRHIMERTRRDAAVCFKNGDDCASTLTRFVWAGDQLLWELRVPGGNDVALTVSIFFYLPATKSTKNLFFGERTRV